jgi:hypothetical protein
MMGWFDKLKQTFGVGVSQQGNDSGDSQHSELVTSWEFCATLQLRTPLRVLKKHGAIHSDLKSPPPSYAEEMWEGIWTPKQDSKYDFLSEGATMSSDIGYVPSDGGDLLPFLIGVREIVETELPIDQRRKQLFKLLKNTEWSETVSLYGGDASIADRLFPTFLESISGFSKDSIAELYQANLRTPESLEKSSDKDLLKVKGIGPSKLKIIRETCSTSENKLCEWTDVPKNEPDKRADGYDYLNQYKGPSQN